MRKTEIVTPGSQERFFWYERYCKITRASSTRYITFEIIEPLFNNTTFAYEFANGTVSLEKNLTTTLGLSGISSTKLC